MQLQKLRATGGLGAASKRSPTPALAKAPRRGVVSRAVADKQIFQTTQGSWVVTPTVSPGDKVKGVVHFLGGAFAGAAPQVLYSLFLDILADAGYTVITTPYAVTFKFIRGPSQFLSSLDELKASETLGSALAGRPVFSIGHSNGALLHALLGCDAELLAAGGPQCVPAGNIIISYNNKQVSDAIPVPGLMASLPGIVQNSRTSSFQLPQFPSSSELLQQATSLMPAELRTIVDANGQISQAALALDQLSSVFNEVGDGNTDFTPTPSESRSILRASYQVIPTLTIRFENDSIDETPEVSEIMRRRIGPTGLTSMTLPGSHLTPCGGDLWRNNAQKDTLVPADLVAMLLREGSQADIRRLGSRVAGWLDVQGSK
eukprot:gene19880-26582_t